jgi:DNA-damage-inducible protein J
MYLKDVIMPTTMVPVRVDEKTKQRAAKTLAGMGISVSDAVRKLLVRVAAEKALPFDVRVPNATTVKTMRRRPGERKASEIRGRGARTSRSCAK